MKLKSVWEKNVIFLLNPLKQRKIVIISQHLKENLPSHRLNASLIYQIDSLNNEIVCEVYNKADNRGHCHKMFQFCSSETAPNQSYFFECTRS